MKMADISACLLDLNLSKVSMLILACIICRNKLTLLQIDAHFALNSRLHSTILFLVAGLLEVD
jgi:hypothetical protein